MKRIIIIAITLLIAHPSANAGFPAREMYDFTKLQQEKTRYQRKINEFYQQVLLPQLDKRDQATLSGIVTLDFPLTSEHLLNFYAKQQGSQATVILPVSSLFFLEDLTTAFAWLHVNGYSGETVEEYITMLKHKDASEFPGKRYPTPLEALFVPQDALSDKQVDILGLRLRNTAYAFIILHELAHILYRHRSYSQISTEQARAQETEADQFALRTLERADTIPGGIIVFFAAQVNYFPNRGQFLAKKRSEREWQRYIQESQTHPLTTERLKGMARYLDGWSRRAGANEADTLAFIATRLFKMAEDYDDPEMQGCLAVVAERADPKSLAPRKHGSKAEAEKLFFQHCHTR